MTHQDDVFLMLLWTGSICLVFAVGGVAVWLYEAYRRWRYQRLVRRYRCAIPRSKLRWM